MLYIEVDLFHLLIQHLITINMLYMNMIYTYSSPDNSTFVHLSFSFDGEILLNYFSYYLCILLIFNYISLYSMVKINLAPGAASITDHRSPFTDHFSPFSSHLITPQHISTDLITTLSISA